MEQSVSVGGGWNCQSQNCNLPRDQVHVDFFDEDAFSIANNAARRFFACLLWLLTLPFSLFGSFIVIREHERAFISRFGLLVSDKPQGPGVAFVNLFCDRVKFFDIRDDYFIFSERKYFTKDWIAVSCSIVIQLKYTAPECFTVLTGDAEFIHVISNNVLRLVFKQHTIEQIWPNRKRLLKDYQMRMNSKLRFFGVQIGYVGILTFDVPVEMLQALIDLTIANRKQELNKIAATRFIAARMERMDNEIPLKTLLAEFDSFYESTADEHHRHPTKGTIRNEATVGNDASIKCPLFFADHSDRL